MGKKSYNLIHPLHGVPAVATQEDYWREKGRAVGLELQFCDGHRACMTYAEIQAAQVQPEAEAEAMCNT